MTLAQGNYTNRFAGKVALVTGSGRGIGRAIALRLASEGADVVVNFFRNREPAEETAAEIRALGRRCELVKANVAEADDLKALFGEVKRAFGGLDILVNNAASGYNRSVLEQHVKGWDWTMNINARAVLFASQQAVLLMEPRGGGAIVNLSSIGAHRVLPEYVVVGASKAALEAVTRYLAVELAQKNIVVNAVSAGPVDTEALKYFPQMREALQKRLERMAAYTPAGRNVTAEDIAGIVAFLCTSDAAMMCGHVVVVDGGFTLCI
jgi:enoyl-[acyl-carrier protein] reductase III